MRTGKAQRPPAETGDPSDRDGTAERLAAADRAVAALAAGFIDYAQGELASMQGLFGRLTGELAGRAEAQQQLYRISHDLKGQGTTFGFEAITRIAALLCTVLQSGQGEEDCRLRIVKAHIDALAIVAGHRIAGDGGPACRAMVDRLESLARRAAA